jgi:FkbM family methyltransferase
MKATITRELLERRKITSGSASTSQINQDVFVLEILGSKQSGYFVDVGAANGVELSNTHLLEKKFAWKGILVEPARCWHPYLRSSRTTIVDTRAAWSKSGIQLPFLETDNACLASLECRADGDGFTETRLHSSKTYPVTTVSLQDLLLEHQAPPVIDYLSLDTEGSESDILEPHDFSRHRFLIITCEHNHNQPRRQKTHDILTSNGYRRVCEDLSSFEDWYVHESVE